MLYWLMRVICGHGVGNMGGGGGIGMIVGLPILLVVLMPAGVRVSSGGEGGVAGFVAAADPGRCDDARNGGCADNLPGIQPGRCDGLRRRRGIPAG